MVLRRREEIQNFENKYDGERIFVIGNGPSLAETPLESLNSEYTFAMNKINSIYDSTDWRPSFYHVSQQPTHPEAPNKGNKDYIQENIDLGITCFLRSAYSDYNTDNVYLLNVMGLNGLVFDKIPNNDVPDISLDLLKEFWSEDASNLVYHYHSMYSVLQLVKYMGFDEIYLLGCDLGFEYIDPHMIFEDGMDPHRYGRDYGGGIRSFLKEAKSNGTLMKSFVNGVALKLVKNTLINRTLNTFLSNSDSYFTSNYTEEFRIHDGPRVDEEITRSHLVARRICSDDGVKIYNSTFGGELDVYDRKDLNEVLISKQMEDEIC